MPRTPVLLIALTLALTAPAGPALSHEFWIETDRPAPDRLTGQLRVGQNLSGATYSYNSEVVASMLSWPVGSDEMPVAAREGDAPAIAITSEGSGLHRLTVRTNPGYVVFDTLPEFAEYVADEGLGWVLDAHRARGLPLTDIAEAYVRNAKALVRGDGATDGSDARTDLPFEFVAEGDPFAPDLKMLTLRLFWQETAVAGAQVSVFHLPRGGTAPGDTVRTIAFTDTEGRVKLTLPGPGRYLVNAVRMDPAEGPGSVRWRSVWSSLTFERAD